MRRAGPLKGVGKRMLCLLLIASLPILPGCWDRKELNEIALIRAIGIDQTEEGQIEVTLLQALPHRAGTRGGEEAGEAKGSHGPKRHDSRSEIDIAAEDGPKNFRGSPGSDFVGEAVGEERDSEGHGLRGATAAGATGCPGVRD